MTWRRALVWFLAAGAAVLSFDALRAYALGAPPLAGGVIPTRTIVDREWLAALWAIEIDAMAAAGILGARQDRKDWRAWSMFVLAAACSIGFQVLTLPAILARAVPPLALFLAIVVLELPRARPDWPPPQPPRPVAEPATPVAPPAEPATKPASSLRTSGTRRHRQLTSAELVKVQPLIGAGRKAYGIAQELGIPYPVVRQHMRDQELVSTNGDRSGP
jgi:hypothetical protein